MVKKIKMLTEEKTSKEITKKCFTNEKKSYRIAQTTNHCEETYPFQRNRI